MIVVRNPHEIMGSWQARWNCSKETVYAAISTYYFNLLKYAQKYDVLTIDFDDVIKNNRECVEEIHTFIPGLKSYNQAKPALLEFIDAELKHHNAGG